MIAALLTLLAQSGPVVIHPQPQRSVERWVNQRPQPRGDALLRQTMIDGHNRARLNFGVPPLGWDPALARDAAVYARVLARSGRFEHDPQQGRRFRQGENLWMGTRSAYSYGEMIGSLVGERRHFRPGVFPDVSRTGNWSHVGHYTQIIWPATRAVGCAIAFNRTTDYLVCRYFPAGNIAGTVLR